MKISVITIASDKPKFGKEIDEYLKRIPWKVSFRTLKAEENKNISLQKEKEGKKLLQEAAKCNFIIALDERGETPDSPDFAELIGKVSSYNNLAILVGGAFGLSEEVRQKAHKVISLSKLTYPHKFIPLILSEQLYRAYSILNNHPYHK